MKYKKLLVALLIILILAGIAFRIVSLNKEFSAEETDFVNAAIAIKDTGHPIYYLDEQWPKEIALWHPPMYIYLMSLFFMISTNEASARMINFIFSLLVAGLIFLFCYKLIEGKKGKIIGFIATAFFLVNYYVLSSSIMIDIDLLSTFFILGFVYFILRYEGTSEKKHLIFSGIFLFFAIWNRYPIAGLTYIALGVYILIKKELRKDFKKYLMVGVCACLLFLISWTIYSVWLEPGNFLTFIKHNANMGGEQLFSANIYFPSFLLNIAQFIRLFTFPAVILLLFSVIYFLKKRNRSLVTNFLLVYTIPILLFFILIPRPAFGYPRYFMSALPGIIILISLFVYKNLKKVEFNRGTIWFIVLNIVLCLGLLIMLNPQSTIYSGTGLIKATNFPDLMLNIFCSVPILFAFLFREKKKEFFILILICLMFSYSIYFDVKLIADHQYSREVGTYIRERTSEGDLVIASKSVKYYMGERKFYLNDNNKPELDFSVEHLKEYFEKSFENREMNENYFWPKGMYSGIYPPIPPEKELEKAVYVVKYYPVEGYTPEKVIGGLLVYRMKN